MTTTIHAKPRLLCVDDEPELLDSIRLVLRKRFDVSTAQSGAEALAMFDDEASAPFDAVVSDMRMPEMNGATFLTALRERHPDVPRLLLSGQADLDSAIAAINDAKIFRFLTKPCPPELLIESIDEAVQQARLRHIERDLLDRTLNGTVDMLTDVLGLISAEAAERSGHIKTYVHRISHALDRPVSWDLDLAAMLSQLGHVVLTAGEEGETDELLDRRVELAAELLIRIPRLESVAALVRGQRSPEPVRRDDNPNFWTPRELNAEILRLAVRFDASVAGGLSPDEAFEALMFDTDPAAPFLLAAVGTLRSAEVDVTPMALTVRQLMPGMILAADLELTTGPMLAPAEMELTAALIGRVQSFARSTGVREPIEVLVPAALARQMSR